MGPPARWGPCRAGGLRGAPVATSRRSASSLQDLGEPVDLLLRAALGEGDEQDVVHPWVVAAERVAGMDSLAERILHDLACVPSDTYGKLLECCPIRKRQFEAGGCESLLRVLGKGHAGLPPLAQSLRPKP